MPPDFVNAGKQLSHNALGAINFYPQSSIILKEGTHMMDGRLFPKLLDVMAEQIPGATTAGIEKTRLYPPNKDIMLAAAAASMEGGKQQPTFTPWIPLAVDDAMLRVAARRSAQPQPSLHFPAEDGFYCIHEVVSEPAKKAVKARKGSCK
ncbi:hypothetical protein QJQ45_009914 [Haematococcus lacustris]|nr:hypothetical protein QJQ45_009914 [Haematococcus lacustris]